MKSKYSKYVADITGELCAGNRTKGEWETGRSVLDDASIRPRTEYISRETKKHDI